MAYVDDGARKVKGKGQKLRGKMRSDRIDGTMDKIKGAINETIADARLRNNERSTKK